MGSTQTGEMFTQAEYNTMTPQRRKELDLVRLTPAQSAELAPLTPEQRKQRLQKIKANSHRIINKRERQNRKKARAAR